MNATQVFIGRAVHTLVIGWLFLVIIGLCVNQAHAHGRDVYPGPPGRDGHGSYTGQSYQGDYQPPLPPHRQHRHNHGDNNAAAAIVGGVAALVILDAIAPPPPPPVVVRPQCFVASRQVVNQYGQLVYDHYGRPVMQPVRVCPQ